MQELRPVVLVTGVILLALAAAMLVPMVIDLAMGEHDWRVFAWSAAITAFFGLALTLSAFGPQAPLTVRAAFLLTVSAWTTAAAFGSIPFLLAGIELGLADAFFESMSGLTTTGATVITGLDTKPPGLLMWRAMLNWFGGAGIIVMAIAVLPMLRVGGLQLFRLESSDRSDKILPRAPQIAQLTGVIYLALTLTCILAYQLCGMGLFDAVAHAFATVSTGGFSTSDASMGAFIANGADIAAIPFMVAGALPFLLYFQIARGKPLLFWRDPQVRGYFLLLLAAVLLMTAYLAASGRYDLFAALRAAAFNVVSMSTSTGFATADFAAWGGFSDLIFVFVMVAGGCSGSTTGGAKIFRVQVAAAALRRFAETLTRPRSVAALRYGGRRIDEDNVAAVLGYLFLLFCCIAAVALALAVTGLDPVAAISGAVAAVCNVGPGLGPVIGPAVTYAPLPDEAKWVMSAAMLLGRLELLTLLVMLTPSFWRS